MATSILNPGTAEIDPDAFGELLDKLRKDSKKAPATHARVFRFRITAHELVVETAYVDDRGKDRVKILQRVRIQKKVAAKGDAKYEQLRAQFEKAASANRVAPDALAAHRQKLFYVVVAFFGDEEVSVPVQRYAPGQNEATA